MSNKELIQEFLEEKRVENKTESTLRGYNKQLKYYSTYLGEKNILGVNKAEAKKYRKHLLDTGIENSSVNTAIRCLKSFYSYLKKEDYVEENPFTGVSKVDEGVREVVTLEGNEATRLLRVIENERDRVMIKLLLTTGLRSKELRELKVGKLQEMLTIIGKGDKERTVPIQSEILDEIMSYLENRKVSSEYAFCNARGEILGESTLRTIVKKYVRKANLPEKISTHKLRATYATVLYEQGVDILMIQDLLGHSSLETTKRYTKIAKERKREVLNTINFF